MEAYDLLVIDDFGFMELDMDKCSVLFGIIEARDMLQKGGYDENENLLDFLKLCSLLFDVFSYEDIENVSGIKEICCEVELEKSVNSKLIENNIPNEYKFFRFFRNFSYITMN